MSTKSRKQREIVQRELHLLDVARGMLIAQGYAGLSMDRLAEATEFSKGTIYQHFSTKEDLVMAMAAQSSEILASMFERLKSFEGRPRERFQGLVIADEYFSRLHPHAFRSEMIIKMADLEGRASDERRAALQIQENRCSSLIRGFLEVAVAVGDLAPDASQCDIMLGAVCLAIGTHMATSNYRGFLAQIGPVDPFTATRVSAQALLDGFGWKPLSSEWDYAATYLRIEREVFADESRSLRRS